MRFEGKVAIVTGGARGIGRACALRLSEEGARVVIADVLEREGEDTAAECGGADGEARFIYCDVGERLDVRNMLTETLEHFGHVDILVANAGIMRSVPFLEVTEADFDKTMCVNVKGTFLVAQAVARHMVERVEAGEEPGSIITMSSINSVVALPNAVAYSASKGAISQLTKSMALALAEHGIRVNAVGPGSVSTDMLGVGDNSAMRRKILARTPLGRIATPREIAGVVAFLASDDASYITGQTIYPDGGRLSLNGIVTPPEEE
ncbi:SDR family NAD(P)-dependent oxidoreductase [Lutibaculum baratangense]|uniref:3-oxoacyl-[acyl-carrier protein] reductase n=1 Tax=Lutibaculum baratangense AMV1 TaxID=631454 RepID=V4RB59_9HYPH|nr:SDR family NAD(P)-dependent oxidoreductase [Lutibaculum baratangense]ESR22644.1 3-oxoacyl-[acyl-carrier protein] reductase [Lutibaculum baratangense AMV1]